MTTSLKTLLQRRNRARKRAQKEKTAQSVNEFQKLQKEARKATTDAKKEEHSLFCKTFTKENAHDKVKKLKGRIQR